jgi:hypothetical protein
VFERREAAESACSIFKSMIFSTCHDLVDYESYYKQCKQDFCDISINTTPCDLAELYVLSCFKKGVEIDNDWRTDANCEVTCSNGREYKACGNSCNQSCGALAIAAETDSKCNEQCISGCQCKNGQVLNHDNICVAPTECSCFYNEREYFPGESRTKDCNICQCHKGAWQCTDKKCDIIDTTCGDMEEFVNCKSPVITTCYNMHVDAHINQHFDYHCESGCQCINGYVLDETTGKCIEAKNCPCYHGGKSYKEGEGFKAACNNCV